MKNALTKFVPKPQCVEADWCWRMKRIDGVLRYRIYQRVGGARVYEVIACGGGLIRGIGIDDRPVFALKDPCLKRRLLITRIARRTYAGVKSGEISAFRRPEETRREICTMRAIHVIECVSITTIHAARESALLIPSFPRSLFTCHPFEPSHRVSLALLRNCGIPHLLFFFRRFHSPSAIIDNTSNGNPNPNPKPMSNLCPFSLLGVRRW